MNTKERIEKLLNPAPAQSSMDIYEFGKQHELLIINNFGRFIKYFEDFFHIFNVAISEINYASKSNWNIQKATQYLFYPEALRSIHCGFECFLKGYYEESISVIRASYEAAIRILFISIYPSDYEAVFVKRNKQRNFNLSNFILKDLSFDWAFIYRLMSSMAHAKIFNVRERLISLHSKTDNTPVAVHFHYNQDLSAMCINFIDFTMALLLTEFCLIFKTDIDSLTHRIDIKQLYELSETLIEIIETNPKPKFAIMAKDLKSLSKLLSKQ